VAATDGAFVGRWLLDRGDEETAVYLPYASFAARPSRVPRPGLVIGADGAYSWLASGPGDGHVRAASGRWQRSGPDAIDLQPEDGSPPTRLHYVPGEPPSLVFEA
jgi:hypothetical protein